MSFLPDATGILTTSSSSPRDTSPIVVFLDFPDKLFLKIGSYLHCARSLQACTLVCSQWRHPMQETLFLKFAKRLTSSQIPRFMRDHPRLACLMTQLKLDFPLSPIPATENFSSVKRLQLVQSSMYRQSFLCPRLFIAPSKHCLTKIELRKMTTTTSFWRDLFINLDAHKSNGSLRSLKLVECKVVDDIYADIYGLVFFKRLTLVLVRTVGINAFGHRFLLRGLDAIVVAGVRRNGMADLLPRLVRQGPTIRYLALCDRERLFLGVAFPSRLVGKTVLLALENSRIPLRSLSITIEAFWPHNAALDVYLCNLARSKRSFLFNLNVKTLHHQVDFVTDIDTVRDVLPQVYRVLGPRLKMYHVSGYIAGLVMALNNYIALFSLELSVYSNLNILFTSFSYFAGASNVTEVLEYLLMLYL
ncbi:hypothetical protein K435DRAFT_800502 [Dendrothele bispora CBS 962.96]|uniref:F-box domain-containing protein n=1 Tax=Dendrothele bispora (strain CBS 962.96) TaxID=1314807 RepID=A0A4S8LSG6_DENBC|nr:hypothetical protein K435DRAFT_800502 [Dendrothele bispora CBS 962.96]